MQAIIIGCGRVGAELARILSVEGHNVVVIDNGSTDGTKVWVEQNFPQVKVVRTEKNLAYSGGLNFGMDYAFGKMNVSPSKIPWRLRVPNHAVCHS